MVLLYSKNSFNNYFSKLAVLLYLLKYKLEKIFVHKLMGENNPSPKESRGLVNQLGAWVWLSPQL